MLPKVSARIARSVSPSRSPALHIHRPELRGSARNSRHVSNVNVNDTYQLSDKDSAQLAMTDAEYKRLTWEDLRRIVGACVAADSTKPG